MGIPRRDASGETVRRRPAERRHWGKSEGRVAMLALKYLLMILGTGLFGSAGALVAYDIFLSAQLRRLLHRNTTDETAAKRICTA
jgi:hypothetical protein